MSKQIFQYAIVFNPTDEQVEKNPALESKMLKEPTFILAESHSAVTMMAIRSVPTEYDSMLDQVSIVVKPF